MAEQIPTLEAGKCSVIFAEKATGILLTTDGSYYLGKGEFFRVFDSEGEADDFAQAYVQAHPKVECWIRDCDGRPLRLVE